MASTPAQPDLSKNDKVAETLETSHKFQSTTPKVANPSYQPLKYQVGTYKTFGDFYPFYLGEHSHPINRRLHLIGTSLSILIQTRVLVALIPYLVQVISNSNSTKIYLPGGLGSIDVGALRIKGGWKAGLTTSLAAVVQGYVWAWTGHFFFEKNRPATFKHPFFSLVGDFRMLWEVVTFQRSP